MLIPGTNSIKDTGYDVANSCRFNQPDSASLNKTFGTPTNSKKLTISFWFKLMAQSGNDHHAFSNGDANADESLISFINSGDHNLEIKEDVSSSATYQLVTNRVFRDPSAWYHIVVAWDTTQAVAANRLKLYINGTQETSFATAVYPSEDQVIKFNTAIAQYIGKRHRNEGAFFNGHMAEVVFIDGTQYAASDFGEFDSDSPTIWKPKDISGLTFGTNGTYLDFEASDNLGNDANGGTDWSETNLAAVDQATDTPTNNFCTMNPLDNYYQGATFTEGNCVIATASSPYTYNTATMGMSAGKWYWEGKWLAGGSGNSAAGIISTVSTSTSDEAPTSTDAAMYKDSGVVRRNNGAGTSIGAVSDGDIVSFAYDADNNFLYFALNGTWQNSGDPTSGGSGTGGNDPGNVPASTATGFYFPMFSDHNSGSGYSMSFNFGNPAFAISSGNADADGYGNFEYAVPSGYYALCTKNLGAYGG